METKASNADKTLIENLVKEFIKKNILINKKTTQGLDSFKIFRNVDQTSQTPSDQTLPDPPQIMNATKIPDTEDIETLPNSPPLLNDILTPDMKIKQTTSFSNSFQESFYSLKAELCELKLFLMNEICEVRNSIREQIKGNKRLFDELETKDNVIKLLIDNFKQLADSIGKSNTVPLLQTLDFSEAAILYCLKNMHTENFTINHNQQMHYP